MNTSTSLGRKAIHIFERHFEEQQHRCSLAESQCPAPWLLEQIVQLLHEMPHADHVELRAAIHAQVVQHSFHDDGGDASAAANATGRRQIEAYVDLLAEVLEAVREEAADEGLLPTSSPASIPMFG